MGAWRGTSNTVSRALALIEAGALDGETGGDVEALAGRLGVGERQLRRLFRQHLGVSPVSVAQTRRVLLAKQLIQETDLPLAEVSLAAGFGSVRRFNETFQQLYGRPPSELRRRRERTGGAGLVLGLTYREPYDRAVMLEALSARGDWVAAGRWTHRLAADIDGAEGRVEAEFSKPGRLQVTVEAADLRVLPAVLARVRRVFDLSADPDAVARDLGRDPILAPLVAARPGLRLPGPWIDAGEGPPSDRFPEDAEAPALARLEAWRPWRAYGALHLRMAGLTVQDLERDDETHAA
jgi:AraC family transcriptional regulator of adaptative response / DNA-3-methyladenine glycosylase II